MQMPMRSLLVFVVLAGSAAAQGLDLEADELIRCGVMRNEFGESMPNAFRRLPAERSRFEPSCNHYCHEPPIEDFFDPLQGEFIEREGRRPTYEELLELWDEAWDLWLESEGNWINNEFELVLRMTPPPRNYWNMEEWPPADWEPRLELVVYIPDINRVMNTILTTAVEGDDGTILVGGFDLNLVSGAIRYDPEETALPYFIRILPGGINQEELVRAAIADGWSAQASATRFGQTFERQSHTYEGTCDLPEDLGWLQGVIEPSVAQSATRHARIPAFAGTGPIRASG